MIKLRGLLLAVCLIAASLFFSCQRQNAEGAGLRELRFGLSTEPVTFDPLNPANTADGRSILFNVFEGLVKPEPAGSLVPAIAESYRIEENGLVYIFSLRPGVLFHDGTVLTASDVLFSLNTAVQARFPGLSQIAEIEISGLQEITIRLYEPDPEFLPFLTVGIVPENNADRERNPIGTGPFMIKNYAPQQSLVLEKNPHYWQAGIPMLDRVTIVFVADTNALLTGLRGGNIDGADVTGGLLHQLNERDFDIFPWHSSAVQLLALNNARAPLNDLRVRQAINYAVDINEIIEIAFFGKGEPSGSPLIPGLKHVYNESLRDPFPRNITRAKSLLAEAGFPDGFPLEITVPSNYTMHVDTAQVIVNQLAPAGISANIRLVDWATWLAEVHRGRNFQATIISLAATNVSPRSFLARYLSTNSGNFMNFNNPEYDRLFNTALRETDEEKRIMLYKQAQQIISENAASVFIQDIINFRVFRGGRFGGMVSYPLHVIDFAAMYRRN